MPQKILIVDDDADIRSELKEVLDGYEILEAAHGEEALRLLKKANDIGLVILDVMMPGISGLDVLSEMKRREPGLHIIILTGHSSKDIAIEALKSHADDYIEKPITVDKIKDAAEKMLGRIAGEDDGSLVGIKNKITKVKDFIERNCFKKTSLKDAAEAVYLSPKYLSRIFKEEVGTGFNEYKLNVKMEKAKGLLANSGYNVNQISEKLGYENTESFIRQFKKLARCTPVAYRKKTKTLRHKGKKK